jgi:Tol biopolymer transport system component
LANFGGDTVGTSAKAWIVAATLGLALTGCISRVSVSTDGAEANWGSNNPSISADGRYVAFDSEASTLVDDDTNGDFDVFVRDTVEGTTERVSLNSDGDEAESASVGPSISADGRYVAFTSYASNLSEGDENNNYDVFVRDLATGVTTQVSVDSNENGGNDPSGGPSISADGRYVAFGSYASNLVAGTNPGSDIFVRDTVLGMTTLVSVPVGGTQPNNSEHPSISADGQRIAFDSEATNLVAGDTNNSSDIFVRNVATAVTSRVSVSSAGSQAVGWSHSPSISANGRFVTFASSAPTLVAGDTNVEGDVFVRDTVAGTTERANVDSAGGQVSDGSSSTISADGHFVAFASAATNLVADDTNALPDVFVRDRVAGQTKRISVNGNVQGNFFSSGATISSDGRFVAFVSQASNLVPGDTNSQWDIFVRAN